MKVVKPQKLGVLTRCIEFKQKFRLGISVLMHVPLSNSRDLYSEVSLWKLVAEELGKDAPLDASTPKLRPEFLLNARAFAPGGEPTEACAVRAKLGSTEKTLFVFGDRWWQDQRASRPQPFTEMQLDWSRAFGGPEFAANPLGRGIVPVPAPDGSKRVALPNIEAPQQRITTLKDRPDPAGFGPLDQMWPQRAARVGTYDGAWLKEDFPGLARDIDWRFFNVASPDQWLDFPVAENIPYEFENLHPQRTLLHGQLPGFSARCFVNRACDDDPQLEKVAMRLATCWFFPHVERAILIYQGFVDVAEEDAADIRQLMIAAENSDEPKSSAHYLAVLKSRLDKEHGALNSLREGELLPAHLDAADPDTARLSAMFGGEMRLQRNASKPAARKIAAARAEVAALGLDPDEHAPAMLPPPEQQPSLEQLPDYIAKKMAEAEQHRIAAEADTKRVLDETEALFHKEGLSFAYVREEISQKPKGPPQFTAKAHLDAFARLADNFKDDPVITAELEGYYKDPEFQHRLIDGERKMRAVYLQTADLQDAAPPMPEDKARRVHDGAMPALRDGITFAGLDLTGADLSGLDLSGANFAGAFLECANFEKTRLVGCDFSNAVLTRARLTGADLSGANLVGANLGRIECDGTRFDGADCTRAVLRDAKLTRSSFRGACLVEANCKGALFEATDWSEVRLDSILFLETRLCGVKLRGAKLAAAVFIKCDVSGVDFQGANLERASMISVKGAGADFSGANLHKLCCVESCDFSGANFSNARMVSANLRGSALAEAHFEQACLDQADLSESDLRGAWFYMASAVEARFTKADLRDAIMVSTNLMNALLPRSNLLGADFRLSNLFQADFARVHVDRSVKFDRALRTRMRTMPRRRDPQP